MAQEIVTTILGATVHQLAIYCHTVSKEMYCFTGLCSLCLYWSFSAEVTLQLTRVRLLKMEYNIHHSYHIG